MPDQFLLSLGTPKQALTRFGSVSETSWQSSSSKAPNWGKTKHNLIGYTKKESVKHSLDVSHENPVKRYETNSEIGRKKNEDNSDSQTLSSTACTGAASRGRSKGAKNQKDGKKNNSAVGVWQRNW